MTDELSLRAEKQYIDIETNKSDLTAAFVRSILGVAPIVGPAVVEVITSRIPNQKIDRVSRAIKVLEDRLKYVEEGLRDQKFMSEEFADLLEDALPQMARSLSDERRAYIANLLTTSLTDDALDHLAKKRLLSMLNELNDAEIILLHFYATRHSDKTMSDRMVAEHQFISSAISWYEKKENETNEEELMFQGYRGTLWRTSLLMGPVEDEYPSPMGFLLLRYIQPENK